MTRCNSISCFIGAFDAPNRPSKQREISAPTCPRRSSLPVSKQVKNNKSVKYSKANTSFGTIYDADTDDGQEGKRRTLQPTTKLKCDRGTGLGKLVIRSGSRPSRALENPAVARKESLTISRIDKALPVLPSQTDPPYDTLIRLQHYQSEYSILSSNSDASSRIAALEALRSWNWPAMSLSTAHMSISGEVRVTQRPTKISEAEMARILKTRLDTLAKTNLKDRLPPVISDTVRYRIQQTFHESKLTDLPSADLSLLSRSERKEYRRKVRSERNAVYDKKTPTLAYTTNCLLGHELKRLTQLLTALCEDEEARRKLSTSKNTEEISNRLHQRKVNTDSLAVWEMSGLGQEVVVGRSSCAKTNMKEIRWDVIRKRAMEEKKRKIYKAIELHHCQLAELEFRKGRIREAIKRDHEATVRALALHRFSIHAAIEISRKHSRGSWSATSDSQTKKRPAKRARDEERTSLWDEYASEREALDVLSRERISAWEKEVEAANQRFAVEGEGKADLAEYVEDIKDTRCGWHEVDLCRALRSSMERRDHECIGSHLITQRRK